MKKNRFYLGLISAIFLFAGGIYLGTTINKKYEPPEGYFLVSEAEVDSLNNLEPEVVYEDSLVYGGTIVLNEIPEPEETEEEDVVLYSDSIVNDSTRLFMDHWVRGEIVNREIRLQRAIKYREVRVPFPQYIKTKEYILRERSMSLYAGATAFGNYESFYSGVEAGMITKGNTQIGALYFTDFNQNYAGFSVKKVFDLNF